MVTKHDDNGVVLEPEALQAREHPADVKVGVTDCGVVAPPENPGPGHVCRPIELDRHPMNVGWEVPEAPISTQRRRKCGDQHTTSTLNGQTTATHWALGVGSSDHALMHWAPGVGSRCTGRSERGEPEKSEVNVVV